MPEPQVVRIAEFLAAHALVLLGAGIACALAALAAIVAGIHLLRQLDRPVRDVFAWLAARARDSPLAGQLLARAAARQMPAGYLAVHLGLGLLATAAVTGFLVIAEEVVSGGEVAAFDVAFARALQRSASPAWRQFFTVVTWFGTVYALSAATIAVAAGLLVAGRRLTAVVWLAAQAGGGLLNLGLKEVFERTRPELADSALAVSGWSFPSGHAMGTFVLCGLGGYLLLRDVRSWAAAAAVSAALLSWCILIGFSRLYLGVHYASDVLAGVVAGVAWVAVCGSAFEAVRRRDRRSRHV